MHDRDSVGTTDQRRTDRKALEAGVTMHVETSVLLGQSDNVSRAGILFYSDQPVRVTIELADPSGPRRYHGKLIRLQRMSESSTGLAVEFDPD